MLAEGTESAHEVRELLAAGNDIGGERRGSA
jgi:hypothetical protein